jgi:RNA polymerase sigma-70 factor, ECF subfamily
VRSRPRTDSFSSGCGEVCRNPAIRTVRRLPFDKIPGRGQPIGRSVRLGTDMSTAPALPAAFADVFDEVFLRAYGLAYRMLGHVAASEDVAAEAMARAFLHWEKVRELPHRDAWVLRVTANLAIDALRRRPVELPSRQPGRSPEELVDLRLALAAALRSLPKRQRQAIVLRYLADLPSAEVATVLHISPGSVKLHIHRGLKALRERLGSTLPEVLDVDA